MPSSQVKYTHENHSSVVSVEDAKNVRTVVKVFLTRDDERALQQAVQEGTFLTNIYFAHRVHSLNFCVCFTSVLWVLIAKENILYLI